MSPTKGRPANSQSVLCFKKKKKGVTWGAENGHRSFERFGHADGQREGISIRREGLELYFRGGELWKTGRNRRGRRSDKLRGRGERNPQHGPPNSLASLLTDPDSDALSRQAAGGGTGFIGAALTQLLKARGHEVTLVSRKPGPGRITWDELATSGLPRCDAAVNLAGENILNPLRRWNETFQKEVLSSRLETTQILARAINKAPQPPQAWVLVTGVAYYQPSLTAEYDEDSPGGDFDFFSNLVTKWEAAARLPGESTRQVVVRSGVVLGRGGGAIHHMLLPFRLGLGGPIGSGHQFFPWIHIQDLAGILVHALEASHVQGVLNGVAPAPTTTNAEFAKALGAALGCPAFIPLPGMVVQAVFGRERAIMLLEGQKVVPRKTLASGYRYSFPELGAALKEVVA